MLFWNLRTLECALQIIPKSTKPLFLPLGPIGLEEHVSLYLLDLEIVKGLQQRYTSIERSRYAVDPTDWKQINW